jgi:hypothetical protein
MFGRTSEALDPSVLIWSATGHHRQQLRFDSRANFPLLDWR